MPRKKGEGKKKSNNKSNNKSSYKELKFNKEDKRTMAIGNAFIAGEGKLTRNAIISMFNKTYFGQLKANGWIKENKGFFKPTNTFKKGFSPLIGKEKVDYGGNGASPNHQEAIINIISSLPKEALINQSYKSGKRLTNENKYYKKTAQYKKDKEEIQENNDRRREEATKRYNDINNNPSISREDKILAKSLYDDEIREINLRDKVINDKRNISPVDFQVTLSKEEAIYFINNLRENVYSFVDEKHLDAWMEQIRYMEEKIVTTTELEITYNLEVVTDTYREAQIIAKENWEYVTKQEIFLLPV